MSGLVKRTALKLYRNVNRSGIIAINLKDEDRLVGVRHTLGDDHIMLITRGGMSIRFNENDARAMGRNAAGVKGISLPKGGKVVGIVRAEDDRQLLTICENGYGKRTPMTEYLVQPENGEPHPQKRGGKGRVDIATSDRNGPVAATMSVKPEDEMMLITERGMIVRTAVEPVRQTSRGTQGVRVIRLRDGDRLVAVARIDDPGTESVADGTGTPAAETAESGGDSAENSAGHGDQGDPSEGEN